MFFILTFKVMYDLPHFKAENKSEIIAFMQAHPFVTLCGCGSNGLPVATHVPVLMEEKNGKLFLEAHVMRAQKHTEAFEQNNNVLVIFSGAHSYISASWYKQKKVASTWNYQAVHAQGKLYFTGEKELHQLLVKLTETFEENGSPSLVQQMKPEYVSSMMKHIVAFEIEITNLEHVFKLSQNRDDESYSSIVNHLSNEGNYDANEVAGIMKERRNL